MVMPSSGPLNMGGTTTPRSVAAELGLGLTSTISMNQANVRTLAGVGGSGTQWSMSSLYGKSNTYSVQYLVLGGGGGPLGGGGGGGGGFSSGSMSLSPGTSYTATVGAGANQAPGTASSFNGVSGGGGNSNGINTSPYSPSSSGGSGSGAWGPDAQRALGTAGGVGLGNSGGNWAEYDPGVGAADNSGGGGGGGAGGAGGDGTASDFTNIGGNGGAGATWLNGLVYGGGGGGGGSQGAYCDYYAYGGTGGSGVGGNGAAGGFWNPGCSPAYTSATNGVVNRGGGGGGSALFAGIGLGSSGIVIIRYAGAQRGTGGTVVSSGGYTYHYFYSSGTYTA